MRETQTRREGRPGPLPPQDLSLPDLRPARPPQTPPRPLRPLHRLRRGPSGCTSSTQSTQPPVTAASPFAPARRTLPPRPTTTTSSARPSSTASSTTASTSNAPALAMKRDFLLDLSTGFVYDCLDWGLARLCQAEQRRLGLEALQRLPVHRRTAPGRATPCCWPPTPLPTGSSATPWCASTTQPTCAASCGCCTTGASSRRWW